jgi:endonuclease YncB( thermonuclease family)
MFGWRKKNQGFEWHQYVRTTIKHRRDDRRQRVEKVKKDAIDGVKGAGKAGVAASARGAKAAWAGLLAMPGAAMARFAPGISRGFGRATGAIADVVGGIYDSLPPLSTQLAKPGVRSLLCLTGLVAAGSGAVRVQTVGFDRDAKLALSCAAILGLLALIPVLSGRGLGLQIGKLAPKTWGLKTWGPKTWGQGLASVGAAAALLWVGSLVAGQTSVAGLSKTKFGIANLNPFKSTIVEGSASAVTGDVLRLQGQLVRLDGVEAPDREQRCGTATPTKGQGKRWACGEAAVEMLARTVRGKTVRCSLSGTDDLGRPRGSCLIGDQNVGAELVRVGLAFSDGGLLSGFGSLERDARNQKLGIWRGDADRPSEHRAKLWADAKKAAPDGCPIKGQMVGDAKRYVMPWQQDYARARVRIQKGERWFCSEQEAKAAGWKVTERI